MPETGSRVTIHMVASLDSFIARKDGSVDWLETTDVFEHGETLAPEFVREFLKSIDCYVLGARTYETALAFDRQGQGWPYRDTPVFVLTSRAPPKARETTRDTVAFHAGDLAMLLNGRLRSYRRFLVTA